MAKAMQDPDIAKAFMNPALKPITKKIMADPSILSDPLNRLKDDLASNPEAAAAAQELLPKLQELIFSAPTKTPAPAPTSAPAAFANFQKIMTLAMKEPAIAKAFANPVFKPIVAKITADPTILSDPLNRLSSDLVSDPEISAVAQFIFPKIQAIVEKVNSDPPPQPKGPSMWSNQADLPRLPIPELSATRDLFLEVVEPIVTPVTFEFTKEKAEAFFSGPAAKLQAKLEEIDAAAPDHSWFHNFHNDMYMNARYPTFLYKNPCGVCKDELLKSAGIFSQLDTASHIVCSTLVFARKVLDETLTPDEFKGFSLDMLQYDRMFGTTRLPGHTRDTFVYAPDRKSISHFVVTLDGRWWKIDVGGDTASPNFAKVKAALSSIMSSCLDEKADNVPAENVGSFTCDDRETWASNRESLIQCGPDNEKWINTIDTALFVLCLDPPDELGGSLESAMRAAVHGDVRSRWFDKPLQLIVTADGKVCSNSEHSWGDGIALVRWGGELLKEISDPSYPLTISPDDTTPASYSVSRFQWNLTMDVIKMAELSTEKARNLARTWTFSEFYFEDFGADFFKEYGFSPDSVMQQIMQLAYHKRHNKMVSAYCVAQHMAFKAGRNERMRGSTTLAAAFVDSVTKGESVAEQHKKLKAACARHSDLSRMCTMGLGFDRHMYALSKLAEIECQNGGDAVPDLFTDDGFVALMTDTLCSSSLDAPFVEVMMANPAFSDFADSVDDDSVAGQDASYFVVYMTRKSELRFCINGFVPGDMLGFKKSILEAIGDVKKIIMEGGGTPKKVARYGLTIDPVAHEFTHIMALAMKDKEIAKAFANPLLKSITVKISKDPTILADPLVRLADDLAENPEAARVAAQLFPKLQALVLAHLPSSAVSAPDYKRTVMAAMKDREIAKAFANPALNQITAKILKDPSILSDPMKYLAEELAASPEAAKAAHDLLPKLQALIVKDAGTPKASRPGTPERKLVPYKKTKKDPVEPLSVDAEIIKGVMACAGLSLADAQKLVDSTMSSEKRLEPEIVLLCSFIFAGFANDVENSEGLKMIVDAMKKREKAQANKKLLDADVSKSASFQGGLLDSARESAEFRHSVYNGEDSAAFEARYNAKYSPKPDPDADVANIAKTITDVPQELRKLFALSDKYASKNSRLKSLKLTALLNSDYTLEKTGYKNAITALHVAAWKNDYVLIRLLLDRGGDPEVADYWHKKPRDYTRDKRSLKELGALEKAGALCAPRTSLRRRILQKASFVVEKQRSFRSKEPRMQGKTTSYDLFNKSLYVVWEGSEKQEEVAIYLLHFVECLDEKEEIKTLFQEIKDRVEIVKNGLCAETAKKEVEKILKIGTAGAIDFVAEWQSLCWESIMSDTILEMIGDVAALDIAEALAEKKRLEDEERERLLEIARKKEIERIKALNFKKYVHDFSAKNVNKLVSESVGWLGCLIYYFRKFDLDGNGTLSPVEMVAALRSLGITKKVQQSSLALQAMFTGFRRAQHEMSLAAFVRDMPKDVYDAIKHFGDKGRQDRDKKRRLMLGGMTSKSERAMLEAKKHLRFAKSVDVKKIRRRRVDRDLPPTDDEIVDLVMKKLVKDVLKDGGEKRVIGEWFKCVGNLDCSGGSSAHRKLIKCKVLCVVGQACIFDFSGDEVLPKPRPNMDDDRAMARFEMCLKEYQINFDEMLENVVGAIDLEDPANIIEACVVGAMERNGWEAREKYLEVKKRLRRALTPPLDWEKLTVVWKDGRIEKVIMLKTPPNGGTGDAFEVVLDKFHEKVVKGGASMRFTFHAGNKANDDADEHEEEAWMKETKLVCKKKGMGEVGLEIIGSLCDLSSLLKKIFELTGGFRKDSVNRFKKVRSKVVIDGTTYRWNVTKEEGGEVTDSSVLCEGYIESSLFLSEIGVMGTEDLEKLDRFGGIGEVRKTREEIDAEGRELVAKYAQEISTYDSGFGSESSAHLPDSSDRASSSDMGAVEEAGGDKEYFAMSDSDREGAESEVEGEALLDGENMMKPAPAGGEQVDEGEILKPAAVVEEGKAAVPAQAGDADVHHMMPDAKGGLRVAKPETQASENAIEKPAQVTADEKVVATKIAEQSAPSAETPAAASAEVAKPDVVEAKAPAEGKPVDATAAIATELSEERSSIDPPVIERVAKANTPIPTPLHEQNIAIYETYSPGKENAENQQVAVAKDGKEVKEEVGIVAVPLNPLKDVTKEK
jgi:hypothetical protein